MISGELPKKPIIAASAAGKDKIPHVSWIKFVMPAS